MINVNITIHNSWTTDHLPLLEWSWEKALYQLVIHELQWGGRILRMDAKSLTVRTQIWANTEVTTFSGSEEEMAPLIQTGKLHMALSRLSRAERAAQVAPLVREMTGGKPLLVSTLGGFLMASAPSALAVMLALGHLDEESLALTESVPLEHLTTAAIAAKLLGVRVTELPENFFPKLTARSASHQPRLNCDDVVAAIELSKSEAVPFAETWAIA